MKKLVKRNLLLYYTLVMRRIKQQKVSTQRDKENQVNQSNLPFLHLKGNKKTYLKVCTKEDKKERNSITLDPLLSARFHQNNSPSNSITLKSSKYLQFSYQSSTSILSRHKITPKLRSKMIDWLLQVTIAYKLKDETFFLAIHLMD